MRGKDTPVSHTVRSADGGTVELGCKRDGYQRATAIEAHCSECMGWECPPGECTATLCPLFPYRPQNVLRRLLRGDSRKNNSKRQIGATKHGMPRFTDQIHE
jgi:hypothetical protein